MKRAFWTLTLFITLSFLSMGAILFQKTHHSLHDNLREKIHRDLKMVAAISQGALAVGDYERIEEQIMLWGEQDSNVIDFRMWLGNDESLVEYKRGILKENAIVYDYSIQSPTGQQVHFEMIYDLSKHHKKTYILAAMFFSISAFISILFIVSLWVIMQRLAIRPLQNEIFEREKVEKELRHLRNYLSNIIDSMPSILIGVDTQGAVTQWNFEAQQHTGLSPKEAMGQQLTKAFPRLSAEMEKVKMAIKYKQEQKDPKRLYNKNGETIYEDVTVYPLIANGAEGAVIRVDDVTEKVRLEEMMVQSEKMLSVGGLAAGMAHEINNPLAGIIQTAHVLEERLTSETIPANLRAAEKFNISMESVSGYMKERNIFRMIKAINESGRRVAEIVDNMLSFARKSQAPVSSDNIAELMEKTLELASTDYDLKKQYDFKQIEIIREYDENLPLIPCEGAKIQQVILNILRNGAEAMQETERKSRFIFRLSEDTDAGMLRIEIEDNGPGMDEDTRKRIFEPFFTTKQVGVGTGLGLSVSYFIIVENHGGRLTVKSELDKGTKFIIRLPLEIQDL